MSMRIGWIGLGSMGTPMARNLQQEDYALTVYNRTRDKSEALAASGAEIASDSVGVIPKQGVVVSALWDSAATESLVTPEFLEAIKGGVHVGMCTGSPESAARLTKLHAAHGSEYVEAPIFGRPEAVEARQLNIPYSGSAAAKERVRPILVALGGKGLFDMGEKPGLPSVLKQFGNFLIISMALSVSEGLAVVEGAGFDPKAVVDMLGKSLFDIPLFRMYGQAAIEKKAIFNSSVPAKDLGLFEQLAEQHGSATPITRRLLELTDKTRTT